MFSIVPKGFIPDQDNDSLNVNLQAAQGTSYYDMVEVRRSRSPTIVIAEPVRRLVHRQRRRRPGGGGSNNGRINGAADAARAARPVTAQQIAQQLRPQLLALPGLPRRSSACRRRCRSAARMGNSNYNITVQSPNTDELYDVGAASSSRRSRAAARGAGRLDRPAR